MKVSLLIFLLSLPFLKADVKSTTGSIKFDSNADSSIEMTLNESGLGIGVVPSENLHVAGNAIVGQISVGTTNATSNLNLGGSLSFSYETVSSNVALGEHSLVLADTSSSNVVLSLPSASAMSGRTYTIKKISSENDLWIESEESIDGFDSRVFMRDSFLSYIKVMSDGSNWIILTRSSDAEVVVGGDNLIAWWELDESDGTTARDSSLYANSGDLEGGMTFSSNSTAGVFGQALYFDGTDDAVSIATPSDALNAGNIISVSLWLKGDPVQPTTYGRPISKSGGATGWEMQIQNANPNVQLRLDTSDGSNQLSAAATVLDNAWHNYTFTISGNSRIIYLDGNEVVNNTFNYGGGFSNTSSITFGKANNSTKYFQGCIDDVRIYSRVLTASEVAEIYSKSQ